VRGTEALSKESEGGHGRFHSNSLWRKWSCI